jgi:hypothetical protein
LVLSCRSGRASSTTFTSKRGSRKSSLQSRSGRYGQTSSRRLRRSVRPEHSAAVPTPGDMPPAARALPGTTSEIRGAESGDLLTARPRTARPGGTGQGRFAACGRPLAGTTRPGRDDPAPRGDHLRSNGALQVEGPSHRVPSGASRGGNAGDQWLIGRRPSGFPAHPRRWSWPRRTGFPCRTGRFRRRTRRRRPSCPRSQQRHHNLRREWIRSSCR